MDKHNIHSNHGPFLSLHWKKNHSIRNEISVEVFSHMIELFETIFLFYQRNDSLNDNFVSMTCIITWCHIARDLQTLSPVSYFPELKWHFAISHWLKARKLFLTANNPIKWKETSHWAMKLFPFSLKIPRSWSTNGHLIRSTAPHEILMKLTDKKWKLFFLIFSHLNDFFLPSILSHFLANTYIKRQVHSQ